MSKNFYIAPTSQHSGLTTVSLGLVRALQRIGLRVGFFKPITDNNSNDDRSISFARHIVGLNPPPSIAIKDAQAMISRGDKGLLLEHVVANYLKVKDEYDIVVVEGLVANQNEPYTTRLNIDIASNLDSEVVLVSAPKTMNAKELDMHLEVVAGLFASPEDPDVLGVILNKVGDPAQLVHTQHPAQLLQQKDLVDLPCIDFANECEVISDNFQLIGSVPWTVDLLAPRTLDGQAAQC